MQRSPRRQRLVTDLSAVAIDLQSLAQRLSNGTELPTELRRHAEHLAQAGRVAALAARSANGDINPRDLMLFYGVFLSSCDRTRDRAPALEETGYIPSGRPTLDVVKRPRQQRPDMTSDALAERRAALDTA